MKALIDFTIRSNIRNVTDLTVTIESVAIPDIVTTFRINADQLSTRQVLKVSMHAYSFPLEAFIMYMPNFYSYSCLLVHLLSPSMGK